MPHQGSHPCPSLSSPQDVFLWTSRLQAQLRERVFNTVLCSLRHQPHWSIPGYVTQMSLPLRILLAGPQSCEWLETQKMVEAGRHPAGWFLQPRCCPESTLVPGGRDSHLPHEPRALTAHPCPQAPSRTRRQPRSSFWTCTPACMPAAWTVPTGEGRARAPAASSATTRAPRTPRTSARFSRTYGTRSWPATWTRSTCSDPGPPLRTRTREGQVEPAGSGRGVGRRSASPDAPCRSSPRPR